jgi:hypothetical protein
VLPPIVERQIRFAEAVASGLRLAASNCPLKGLEALRARLTQAAQTIDTLIALIRSLALIAKLNHDTIVEIGNDRADRVQTLCTGEGPDHQRGAVDSRFDDARAGLESI